jgi:hypothetical protein
VIQLLGRQKDTTKRQKTRSQLTNTEIYVYYGTNEYNFEKLLNPPTFEPTHCASCGKVISLGYDGYMQSGQDYFCRRCSNKRMQGVIRSEHHASPRRRRRGGR